jgi:hypothetical protein
MKACHKGLVTVLELATKIICIVNSHQVTGPALIPHMDRDRHLGHLVMALTLHMDLARFPHTDRGDFSDLFYR